MQKQSWWCEMHPFDQVNKDRINTCHVYIYINIYLSPDSSSAPSSHLVALWTGALPRFFNEEWGWRILESQNGQGWKGPWSSHSSNSPASGGDATHQIKLLRKEELSKDEGEQKRYQSSTDTGALFLPKVKWKSGFNSFFCSLISFCGGKASANISGIQAVVLGDYWLKN